METALKENAGVVGMSALLTTTMPAMKTVVDLVSQRGLSNKIKTIIGGAPVSADYAHQVGADAYAFDATNAVEKVNALVGVS